MPSSEMPVDSGTISLATSNASVIPAGGVQVAPEANAWAVTSIVLATVVVTLGVACESELAVACPFSTSTRVVVSTPLNELIPPADPVEDENVQVCDADSPTTATRV